MSSAAVYIASGRRTAFGAFGGKLKSYTAAQVSRRVFLLASSSQQPLCTPAPLTKAARAPLANPKHALPQLGGIAGKAALADLPEGVKVDSVHFGSVSCPPEAIY